MEAFWQQVINFSEPTLEADEAPFIVLEETPMSKLHFLFIMLNVSQVSVLKKGCITGVITKQEFVQKKKVEVKKKVKRSVSNDNSPMRKMPIADAADAAVEEPQYKRVSEGKFNLINISEDGVEHRRSKT